MIPFTHRNISFIKSGVRALGYLTLLVSLYAGVLILIASEGIGVYEEVGQV